MIDLQQAGGGGGVGVGSKGYSPGLSRRALKFRQEKLRRKNGIDRSWITTSVQMKEVRKNLCHNSGNIFHARGLAGLRNSNLHKLLAVLRDSTHSHPC